MAGVSGLRGWQWLFLVEGAPAIILGVAAYFYLPDHPAGARFFSSSEAKEVRLDIEKENSLKSTGGTFLQSLANPRAYALAFVYFAFYSAQSVLLLWVPTLLRDAGAHDLGEIGARSALVNLIGGVGMILVGWHSDRLAERRLHLIACGLIGSAAYLCLPLAAGKVGAMTFLLAIAAIGLFSFLALFWTVPSALFGAQSRAGVIAMISSIGAAGSALSPIFIGWTKVQTGSLFSAIDVLALLFGASLIVLALCMAPACGTSRLVGSRGGLRLEDRDRER
jgi:sugar phosphate permease